MLAGWQTIIALMIVAGAIALLLRRVSRWWLGTELQSGGGCGGCPSNKTETSGSKQLPLIELQLGKQNFKRQSE